ncbi:hypothetical protein BGY98DRAFT_1019533 [Russula aff. rugulosa BPL654]|nr:hypothetical protein BGY98DRAFT_1019533 [Russula aff. rugulosa BPL654]
MWGAKRNGISSDPTREIEDKDKCAKLLDRRIPVDRCWAASPTFEQARTRRFEQ